MPEREYKYAVAFSFLSEDEALARSLSDALKGRWPTFVYSEHQVELMGGDGELSFSKVFYEESRLVVVLHRAKWGTTKWTRIEQTAIKNRAYDQNYDFAFFVGLEKPIDLPQWLPRTLLWADAGRFSAQEIAAAIDFRLHQAGGVAHEETVEEMAERLARDARDEQERAGVLATAGTEMVAQELRRLFDVVASTAAKVELQLSRGDYDFLQVRLDRCQALFQWQPSECINTVQDGVLSLKILEFTPQRNPIYPAQRQCEAKSFRFGLTPRTHRPIWQPKKQGDPPLTSEALADHAIKRLLHFVEEGRKQQR
jgi:hypothetical protein